MQEAHKLGMMYRIVTACAGATMHYDTHVTLAGAVHLSTRSLSDRMMIIKSVASVVSYNHDAIILCVLHCFL